MIISFENYKKALKAGKKDYQARLANGQKPTLEVLDEMVVFKDSVTFEDLGLIQIPLDQIVGTRYEGRSSAFAHNFMPLLDEKSEFAMKWAALSTAHAEEGIRDPIKAIEYMNRFYVEEGNKRVSVMKYYDAVSIPGTVTRMIPQATEEKENRIYFEFLDFYRLTGINYLTFHQEGQYKKIQKVIGKKANEVWTEEERINFKSVYNRFSEYFKENGGKKLSINEADAFVSMLELYDYRELDDMPSSEFRKLVQKSWKEFEMLEEEEEVELKMAPSAEKKNLLKKILPLAAPKQKICFIYAKTSNTSAWTYSHELGRNHLEKVFPGEVSTIYYDNATLENIEEYIQKAIDEGCTIIFTTSPIFAQASVKAAIAYPEIRILNCSLNTSHKYIRTYYSRMHEAKFLMGAIAGALAQNDRLVYIADYPLAGTIAHINAFALGAKMVNPRAKVYLEWTTKKSNNIEEMIQKIQPSCISWLDMPVPARQMQYFGITHVDEQGNTKNVAMPLYHWGIFYEKLVRSILEGTWKNDDNTQKAINYWWGMSAGVVDVICSKDLPVGTKRLVELLKQTICTGEFQLFSGALYSQDGIVQDENSGSLSPEQIMEMDWLAENVIGTIPQVNELTEQAKPVISQQGLRGKKEE